RRRARRHRRGLTRDRHGALVHSRTKQLRRSASRAWQRYGCLVTSTSSIHTSLLGSFGPSKAQNVNCTSPGVSLLLKAPALLQPMNTTETPHSIVRPTIAWFGRRPESPDVT